MATRQTKAAPRRSAPRRARHRPRFPIRLSLSWRLVADITALACLVLGVTCVLALSFPSGQLTGPLLLAMERLFGATAFVVPLWLLALGALRLVLGLWPEAGLPLRRLVGAVLATLALPALVHLVPIGEPDPVRRAFELHAGGGALGFYLSAGLADALGYAAAAVVLLAALVLGLLVLFEIALSQAALAVTGVVATLARLWVRAWVAVAQRISRPRLRVNRSNDQLARPLVHSLANVARLPRPKPNADSAPEPRSAPAGEPPVAPTPTGPGGVAWRLPQTGLFAQATATELSQADVRAQAKVIEDTLQSFNIQTRVVEVNSGPTVTQFGLEPAPGVAVNRILSRGNDLALRLGATSLRLEAPVPGKRVVGVEVPNRAGAMVSLRELLESECWARMRSKLRLALGRDVSGHAVIGDLAKMPHLLIAGATGSGKSVCINSIIASLIYQCTPDDLQFVMIDPKMVELVGFNGIPHLRMPVVTDMDRVVGSLKWVVREMERRFSLFAARAARNIEAYNKLVESDSTERRMPFMVVVIDELADMMMTAGDEVERILC